MNTSNHDPSPPPHTFAEKCLILGAVCLAALAMPLSFTGPAVALRAIGHDLGGSPIALNWVTNAFMLSFGSSLMAAGTLADSYGRKRVFLIGVAMFGLCSLALACAPDIVWFDLLRAAQGAASAAALSGGMAALAQEFDGAARTRAFSLIGTTFGVGLAFGPILAGVLIRAFDWHAVLLTVTATSVLALLTGARCMRESRDPQASGVDWAGAISFTGALSLLTYGVLQAPENGWSDPLVIGLLLGAATLFAAFIAIERRASRPMLDLSLFRYPRFVGVQFLAAAPAYAYVVLLVLLPIRFIGIEGHSEFEAGRMMVALSAPMLVVPMLAAYLTRWCAPGAIAGSGLLICAAGLFWLGHCPPGQGAAIVLPMLTIGFGISLPWGLMDGLAVSVVPTERAGMATGIFNTTRVAGEGIALAVVGALLAALTRTRLEAVIGLPQADLGARLVSAAQRVATGDLGRAAAALPEVAASVLVQSYGDAFSTLLNVLSAVTVVSALVVFGFLMPGTAQRLAGNPAA
ncbi:MFS transporter [Paraherbaspirillum soli]|uniref:MFS transporter n=1 Tax=Paraherbaspirillum soli TaxID=631222 RepID=A0ABW0MC12_9BURK